MRTLNLALLLLIILMNVSCDKQRKGSVSRQRASAAGWQAVYRHDQAGKPLQGHIDSLIAGIRNGYDVRVGWGWEKELGDSLVRLEHMAEPLFLTIIQEKHVSAVIDAHPLLSSYLDIENQKIREGGHIWQCVLTSQGEFNAQVHHRSTGELLRDWPQRQRMTWYLEVPEFKPIQQGPLYK